MHPPEAACLLLGPMTRYADATTATVWVETSTACEVELSAGEHRRRERTFAIEGHHYALLVVEDLPPGADLPYEVLLDGRRVWPEAGDPRPAGRLRTRDLQASLEVCFGSCRVDRPHDEPWTLAPEQDPRGVGVDALQALSVACSRGGRPLPDLLLMLGDQVYADEGLSPAVRERQLARRGDTAPREGVADFEEYTWLYRDSWSDPDVRWLLSTVPSVMVFDDHDVRDDWNTSRAWRHEVQQKPWWRARITGAYMSYWVYQHLGNVSPQALREDGLLPALQAAGAGDGVLRAFAERADDEVDGRKRSQWSYVRELGLARLVVVDSRSGRVVEDDRRRSMLSEQEWAGVEQSLSGDCTHLLVATSLPLLLEPSLHDLESWDEALCAGAWGAAAARAGEWLRQAADLEHWAAFRGSFDRLVARLGDVASGSRGRAPSTVLVLSGDVHHSYVAPARYPASRGVRSEVVQLVSSPLRNAFPRRLQRAFRFSHTRLARAVGSGLRRSVRLPPPEIAWTLTTGPVYGNALATLLLDGPRADLRLQLAVREGGEERLRDVHRARLDRSPDSAGAPA